MAVKVGKLVIAGGSTSLEAAFDWRVCLLPAGE
jgi:hypothetical protein